MADEAQVIQLPGPIVVDERTGDAVVLDAPDWWAQVDALADDGGEAQ